MCILCNESDSHPVPIMCRLAKAKYTREQMIEQIENGKQHTVLEEDRRFQESIKLREKELTKRKVIFPYGDLL
jgi:hypothetical protein